VTTHEGGGEFQRDDGLRRQQQRQQQRRDQPVGCLVPRPMRHRAAPAERAQAVEEGQHAPPLCRRALAHRGQVRDQADIPEQPGHQHMRGDAPEIPDEGGAELRPDLERRRIGEDPVEQPGTAEMQDGVEAGHDNGRQRRGLGEAVHRRAQAVPAQHEEHREQAGGIGDADPPDIVDQVEAPDMRDVGAPHARALPQQHPDRHGKQHDGAGGGEQCEPPGWAEPVEGHARDRPRVGDAAAPGLRRGWLAPARPIARRDQRAHRRAGRQRGQQPPGQGDQAAAAHPPSPPGAATAAR
jgi:hypothetical protein